MARWRRFLLIALLPGLLYFLAFCALTFPAITHFSDRFFADGGDGFQNVWNLWWVNHAVTVEGSNPWFTHHLFFPSGVPLISHTLNAFNGFLAIPLLKFLTLIQAHNVVIIFSFVVGGWMAFLLSMHLTGSVAGSLIAGFVFSFSNFHFAHAEGHMQLVALEWIPLFLLCWVRFLEKPTRLRGVFAALSLFLVILCDYYYFLFCCVTALALAWRKGKELNDRAFFKRPEWLPGTNAFAASAAASSGFMVATLMYQNARDPLEGSHYAKDYSLDLLGWLIPGGHWRFNWITEPFWSRLPGNIHESSVHLGFALSALLLLTWRKRGEIRTLDLRPWMKLSLFFMLFALGPCLHIFGHRFNWLKLPYGVAQFVIPPLRLSGCPSRMMVMVLLFAGLMAGAGFMRLFRGTARMKALGALLLAGMLIEFAPKPIPLTPPPYPKVIFALKELPKEYGFIDADDAFGEPGALFVQTVHEAPMMNGYIARVPRSLRQRRDRIRDLLDTGKYQELCETHGLRYVMLRTNGGKTPAPPLSPIYTDPAHRLFDLGKSWKCLAVAASPRG